MPAPLLFLPVPRRVDFGAGELALPENRLILLDHYQPQALRSAAARVQRALAGTGLTWETCASRAVPAEQVGITLRVAPERTPFAQGYRLHLTPSGVVVEGHDPAGVFYGACTLAQIIEQRGKNLPVLEAADWPDIAARGVMLDISRDRVYRMDYLYELVDRLAGWKINQLQLYTEHTFAYRAHPSPWAKASPMTGEEILALDAYCRERFIELVPNQNSFGHMNRWLDFPEYYDLAEIHGEFVTSWGTMKGPFTLAPEHPGSLALISSLYDELLPHFTSRMINVGCDETWDLGQGQTRAACEARGKGRVYFDFLMKVYADLVRRGYTMQFWGDILNNHHPELVAELPRDVIALNWGYEDKHPFDVEAARCAQAGVPFYVCPGTSSWNSIAGRTDNTLANLLNAAENGIRHGALGYLNTDWGDNGHWQVPPVSWLGFAAGAAYAWALQANRDLDVAAALSQFAFEDPAGAMGRVAFDLGNVYQAPGVPVGNASALFWLMQLPLDDPQARSRKVEPQRMRETLDAIDAAIAPLDGARMARPDADLVRREYRHTARLLRHAARRALLAASPQDSALRRELRADLAEITAEYRDLWLARSRPGGLSDSLARFEVAAQEYQGA
jgi:hypothetical protein